MSRANESTWLESGGESANWRSAFPRKSKDSLQRARTTKVHYNEHISDIRDPSESPRVHLKGACKGVQSRVSPNTVSICASAQGLVPRWYGGAAVLGYSKSHLPTDSLMPGT